MHHILLEVKIIARANNRIIVFKIANSMPLIQSDQLRRTKENKTGSCIIFVWIK